MATVDSNEPLIESSELPITPDQPGAIPAPEEGAQPFRFAVGASLSAPRQETLQAWHRPFLRIAAANLRTALRLDVDFEIESIQVDSCGQLLAHREEKSQGVIFRMAPQNDLWLLDLPLALADLIVDRMMGGASEKLPGADKVRELTDLEQIVFQQFAGSLLGDYARNWQPHREFTPDIVRSVSALRNPRAFGHEGEDLLVRVGISAVLKGGKIPLSILLPIATAEELLQRLAGDESAKAAMPAIQHDSKSPIGAVPVAVSIRWQGFQISLGEVEALAPGDLIVLDPKKCEQGVVFLGDRPRFTGKIARDPHKTIVTLSQPL